MQDTNRGRQYTFDGFEVTKANRKAFELSKNFSDASALCSQKHD